MFPQTLQILCRASLLFFQSSLIPDMTGVFYVSSRSHYLCVKYHCSLDSFVHLSTSELIQCKERSEYGPLKLELPLRHLDQMLQLWRQRFYTRSLSWETSAEDKPVNPHSSLLDDHSSFLSPQWRRQNNFWFKRGSRSDKTTNKRLETHTLQFSQSTLSKAS